MRGQRHAPAALYPGKDPVLIVQQAGWAPGPVWTGEENLAPPGFDPRLVCRFGWDAVSSKRAHQTVIYTEWHISDVLIQLILLMMGTWLSETC